MRKTSAGLLSLALATSVGASLTIPSATAGPSNAPASGAASEPQTAPHSDSLPDPIKRSAASAAVRGDRRRHQGRADTAAHRQQHRGRGRRARKPPPRPAGQARRRSKYVELSREDTDQLFVLLVEFGNDRHPAYPDQDTNATIPGPDRLRRAAVKRDPGTGPHGRQLHRLVRTTMARKYYQDLYFGDGSVTGTESMRMYYERQSSGRYSIEGAVTDPVAVQYNEARYGRSDGFPCASNVCSNTWNLVQDGLNAWVPAAVGRRPDSPADPGDARPVRRLGPIRLGPRRQLRRGRRLHRPPADRARRWRSGRRRPVPGRGRHLVAPLARLPGQQPRGTDVHRTAAHRSATAPPGPLTTPSSRRTAAYRSLPTSSATTSTCPTTTTPPVGENSVNWWTLMAQSRVSAPSDNAIGSRAADLSAWDKLSSAGSTTCSVRGPGKDLKLGPHEYNSNQPRLSIVELPDRPRDMNYGAPTSGASQWWSGAVNESNASLTRSVTLAPGTSTLTFQARWNIEDCGADPCDYAYVEVDDGTGFTAVAGNITKAAEGNGIEGLQRTYVPATFDLSAYAGKTVGLRIRYATDRSSRARTRACRLASSWTTSRSRRAAPRCSPTTPSRATTAGPSQASAGSEPSSLSSSPTSTSPRTARTSRTTST